MEFGLKENIVSWLRNLFSLHKEIEKVIIYGSRAMDNYREGSDIDLTIVGENITLSLLLNLKTEINDSTMPYKVDLSIYDKIENPALIKHIEEYGKVFYERNVAGC